jgi:hypothetical protein
MSGSAPRPVLLALLGVVAVAGVFMFMRKGGNNEATPTPAAPATTAPATGTSSAAAPSATGTPARPKPPTPGVTQITQGRTLPAPVSKALKHHKVVVLLFWNRRGVDDRDVKSAVDALPHYGGRVKVFTENLKHLSHYTQITAAANITDTPALVVADGKGEARVATGWLDPVTVEQYVNDAVHGAP